MKREVDLVVISDVHLGTYGCHAKELLDYLKSIKVKTLIINGDFIDIWQFNKQYFPKDHLEVIQRILKMAARGVKVYYITGNHDDALRRFSGFSTGNIQLRDKLVLKLKNQRYWVFHGDIFDVFIRYSPILARLGGKGYDLLILFNRWINLIRMSLGMPRLSFAGKIKYGVKEAVKFIHDFETTTLELAAEEGYDYVICGHIHRPTIREETVGGRKIQYLNSGDWVEHLSALEYHQGKWSLFFYDQHVASKAATPEQTKMTAAL